MQKGILHESSMLIPLQWVKPAQKRRSR